MTPCAYQLASHQFTLAYFGAIPPLVMKMIRLKD